MNAGSDRVHFIDLLRGVAVVAMVIGHTFDAVLESGSRSTVWFQLYTFVRGFTAPVFLFVSGLAFAVATEKHWSAFTAWSPHLRRRLGRIAFLFIVGYALHLPYFSLARTLTETSERELTLFLQSDVLQCIAATLLMLHLLIPALKTTTAFIRVIAGLAFLIAVATPYLWSVDPSGTVSAILVPYLNGLRGSPFPLFPYASFLLAGIVTGHFYRAARQQGQTDSFCLRLAAVSAGIAVIGVLFDLLLSPLYPDRWFWETNPVITLIKLATVMQVILVFLQTQPTRGRLVIQLEALGQASFFVYAFHIIIVYGSAANHGLATLIGRTLDPWVTAATAALLIVLMGALVRFWQYLSLHYARIASYGRIVLVSGIVYLFITRPF